MLKHGGCSTCELQGGGGGGQGVGGVYPDKERGKLQPTHGGKPGCTAPHAPVYVMFS